MHGSQAHTTASHTVFEIDCGGFSLPVDLLPQSFTPERVRSAGVKMEILVVRGDLAPSKTIKYLPARAGIGWVQKAGLGKRILVPSSGNFLGAVSDYVRSHGIGIDIVGVVSSKLPAGKREALDGRGISLLTEIDLARAIGFQCPVLPDLFDLIDRYSGKCGIPVLDQYHCPPQKQWNAESYRPIPDALLRHTGGQVSVFTSTAGTKGKYCGVGVPLWKHNSKTELAVVFPYPGDQFPGGRDEDAIGHVGNSFGMAEPTRRRTSLAAAYEKAALLYRAGFQTGITLAAELATAEHYVLEFDGRYDLITCADGVIRVVLVASDAIDPYLNDCRGYAQSLVTAFT